MERAESDSVQRVQTSIAIAKSSGYVLRPTQPRIKITDAQAQFMLDLNQKFFQRCQGNSIQDAVNAGHTPCSVCRPPTLSEPGTSEAPQAGNPDARVWVNTHSGVYHCPGTRWYGSTKHGEYMTQKQAREKGNRPAYGKPCQ